MSNSPHTRHGEEPAAMTTSLGSPFPWAVCHDG